MSVIILFLVDKSSNHNTLSETTTYSCYKRTCWESLQTNIRL